MPARKRLAARRPGTAGAANHERWMISYADFVTLLFAFFVVMFASSGVDKERARIVSTAVQAAFAGGDSNDLTPSLRLLEGQLSTEIHAGKIRLNLERRGLIVTLSDSAFFQPGDDRIEPGTHETFQKLSLALRKLPNSVRLEGHTDSLPIHNPRFRSNWDLSTARALSVLDLLEDIGRGRLSAAGYADTVPVDSNETETGRARNRRVDLVILSPSGMAGQPKA